MSTELEKRKLRFRKTRLSHEPEREWHWSYTLMVMGWFLGAFVIYLVGSRTLLNIYDFSRYLAFFCLGGMILPFRWYKRYLDIEALEVVFFNLFAVGPLVFSLLLTLNYLVPSNQRVERYAVESFEMLDGSLYGNGSQVRIVLQDSSYMRYPDLRTLDPVEHNFIPGTTDSIYFRLSTGIIGWDVLHEKTGRLLNAPS